MSSVEFPIKETCVSTKNITDSDKEYYGKFVSTKNITNSDEEYYGKFVKFVSICCKCGRADKFDGCCFCECHEDFYLHENKNV